jgi:hypothetical protein
MQDEACEACALAQAIVNTAREPLVVLDHALRVIAADRSFYVLFETKAGRPGASHRLAHSIGLDTTGSHQERIRRIPMTSKVARCFLSRFRVPDAGLVNTIQTEAG